MCSMSFNGEVSCLVVTAKDLVQEVSFFKFTLTDTSGPRLLDRSEVVAEKTKTLRFPVSHSLMSSPLLILREKDRSQHLARYCL